jgi:dissimilatory sulfite reductase (desulfoviridin) alpha/beta subunit
MRAKRLSPASLALPLAALVLGTVVACPGSCLAQAQTPAQVVAARINPEETPDYCHRQYEKCSEDCDKDPLNKTRYDLEACYSSCWSTYSGCGT